jgi:hypothetical protein
MAKYKVGEKFRDACDCEWVVAQMWEHPDHYDYRLFNTKTGAEGSFYEAKAKKDKKWQKKLISKK